MVIKTFLNLSVEIFGVGLKITILVKALDTEGA